eukprot:NODE_162_length_16547_cov_0.334326.p2 type:complete len:391 gc:universal NODE_162_length_16547_cov_0.334326:4712-5884(+)
MAEDLQDSISQCCKNLGVTRNNFHDTWQAYALNNGIEISELNEDRLEIVKNILLNAVRREKTNSSQHDLSSGGLSALLSGISSEGQVNSSHKGEVLYKFGAEIEFDLQRQTNNLTAPLNCLEMYKTFFCSAQSDRDSIFEELDQCFSTFRTEFQSKSKENDLSIDFSAADALSTRDIITFGRILILAASDSPADDIYSSEEKQAVILCASDLGRGIAYLDLNNLTSDCTFWKQSGSIFSGQTCGLIGNNPTGRSFNVKCILQPNIPLYKTYPTNPSRNVVAVAAGPFLYSASLTALDSALQAIVERNPLYSILIGPFIHESTLKQLDLFVNDLYDVVISKLAKCAEKVPHTKFIIIPSPFEAISTICLYPTPPLNQNNTQFAKLVDFKLT